MKLKKGDMVKHRATGEKMIVVGIEPAEEYPIMCRRYVRDKDRYITHRFKEEELELAEDQ